MNALIDKLKKIKVVFLVLSIANLVYVILCSFLVSFSISVTIAFLVLSVLNLLIYKILKRNYDRTKNKPNFFIVFIQIFYIIINIVFLILFLVNVTYHKDVLSSEEEYDYIVVFGAGIKTDENRNFIINSRLDKAIEYAKVNKKAVFVLTGAKVDEAPIEEAMYMKNFMTSNGISLDRIMTDTNSLNTYENIYNSFSLIEKDILKRNRKEAIITTPFNTKDELYDLDNVKLGLMSSDFHLTRIVMISKKLGVNKPYVISAKTNNLYKPYCYMRESLSIFKAWVLGELKYN